jgi:RNA polymerase sigma factor (sigma-70 family)
VLRHIERLWNLGTVGGTTDAELLARFAAQPQVDAELAFEALMQRHGPMVFRVCRDVLNDEHAAEDAFQATFLVLARKARFLGVKDSLGSWLHGVAHRVAARALCDAARRRRHELRFAETRGSDYEVMPEGARLEATAILSEEINRLPERYRAPIVLCYLEAMSYETAAGRLGVTEDAVRGRLARARARLRKRLARRGVDGTGVLAAARAAVPDVALRQGLVRATVHAALSLEAGTAAYASVISRSVVSLSERTCRTMMLTKLRVAVTALGLGVIAAGAVVLAEPTGGSPQQAAAAPTNQPPRQQGLGIGGNFIYDWIPNDPRAGKREIIVDPTRHCIHLPLTNLKGDDRLNDCVLSVSLEKGKLYTITASGEAFMSESTGPDADPFPGVVVLYSTDEEDCCASRQISLAPGKSITFRSPWLINPSAGVSLTAFFIDVWPGQPKRGSYTLTITEAEEPDAAKRAQIEAWLRPHRRETRNQIYERTKPRVDGH